MERDSVRPDSGSADAPERVLARQKRFGERVKELRKAKGYTQVELAERLMTYDVEMHSTTLAKLESGGRPTTAHEVWALASVLGCEYAQLLPAPVNPEEDEDLAAAKRAVEVVEAKVHDLEEKYSAAGQALARAVLELREAEAARDEQVRRYLIAVGQASKAGD